MQTEEAGDQGWLLNIGLEGEKDGNKVYNRVYTVYKEFCKG